MASKYTIPQLLELIKPHPSSSKEYRKYKSALQRLQNPEQFRVRVKAYRSRPEVKLRDYQRAKERYSTDPAFREARQYAARKWRSSNPEAMAESQKRKRNNPIHRIKDNTHNKLKSALLNLAHKGPKKRRGRPNKAFYEELGCTVANWKSHMEAQFTSGMSWDNHGTLWEIDHIIPKHKFKLPEELNACFHYTNTRPLLKIDNMQRRKNV